MYVFFCENVKKANFNFINFFIFWKIGKSIDFFGDVSWIDRSGAFKFCVLIFFYSMREKGDWNGKGYYHLTALGERSGKPDQSVPRTDKHCEPI